MKKLTVNPIPQRTQIDVFTFVDEYNHVIYTCICGGITWAKELFIAQFNSLEAGQARLDEAIIYQARLSGKDFKII